MADSIFTLRPDGAIVPTEHARGPWDSRALHGGAPAALIATAFQETAASDIARDDDGGGGGGEDGGGVMMIARMSFELVRPVPMAVLRLQTTVTRPGRRVQSLRAELRTEEGVLVCEGTATRIAAVPAGLPALPGGASDPVQDGDRLLAGPGEGRKIRFALNDCADHHDFATAMDMRLISGGPLGGPGGGGAFTSVDAGGPDEARAPVAHPDQSYGSPPRTTDGQWGSDARRTRMWMRPRYPLFPDRPMSALARVAAGADFANGISAILPFGDYLFINADLSVSLTREPVGEWIALDAVTRLPVGGVGWAESILHDSLGPVGRAAQALVVRPR